MVVLSLPLGWMERVGLPAVIAVPATWLLLALPLVWTLRRPIDSGPELPAVRTALVLLGLTALGALPGIPLVLTGWIIAAGVAVTLMTFPFSSGAALTSRWWLGGVVLLVGVVLWRPLDLVLGSDAPAHVAAILDATDGGQLLPPDRFPGAMEGSTDPRFGILHGLYAILGGWSGAGAFEVLRWSALFFSPLWFWGHLQLMQRLGLGARSAACAAFVFTLYAGAGRGFGLGASAFPGSVAQTLCALGLAALFPLVGSRRALVPLVLLSLSALVHPFAWWSTTLVIGLAAVLMLLSRETRGAARRWFAAFGVSVLGGSLVLLPRLLAMSGSSGGLHAELNEVVFFGSGMFIADPFWVLLWGGMAAVFAAPALVLVLLLVPSWRRSTAHLVGLATALPVWLISLNPLGAPLAWPAVSYLVVRLGRIVLTTWVWAWMLRLGLERLRDGGRRTVAGVLLLAVALLGFRYELSTAWLHLGQPQVVDTDATSARLDELTSAIEGLDLEWLLAAPRIGYGLRARGGPPLVLTPVAHASPHDRALLDRLAEWRALSDPTLDDNGLTAALSRFNHAALLVDERSVDLHAGTLTYGYEPDAQRDAWLRARLDAMALPVLASGDGWTLFDLRGLDTTGGPELQVNPPPGELLLAGNSVGLVAVTVPDTLVHPGDLIRLEVKFAALAGSTRPERLFLRLEGPMPAPPALLKPVSKLWRKLAHERSGRSATRFGRWVLPADLVVPMERWPDGEWDQVVEVRIPSWIEPGTYQVQPTLHDWAWHPSRQLADYLSDRDGFSGPVVGTVRIAD